MEAYDPTNNTWQTEAPLPLPPENLGAATGAIGQIYAVGGYSVYCGSMGTNEAYNPATSTWTAMASMPTARENLAVARAANGLIYAFGDDGDHPLAANEAYTP